MQLATLRPDGSPANRTIVFRRFGEDGASLISSTDCRSPKAHELHSASEAAICWYLRSRRRQFRFNGRAFVYGPRSEDATALRARRELWTELSPATQRTFFGPAPGSVVEESGHRPDGGGPAGDGPPDSPPDSFCLLWFVPEWVDVLDLSTEPNTRHIHTRDAAGAWSVTPVAP
jgi:PPOX class probable FMN-dependent enzyme